MYKGSYTPAAGSQDQGLCPPSSAHGAKLEQVQRPWGRVCLESSTASKKASAASGKSRRVVRSGVEQTSAGGALELGKNSEVDSERESMMPTENLSHTLVFSTWPPRWPFRFFPVVRGLDTPQTLFRR